MFTEKNIYTADLNVFQEIGKNWALVSAVKEEGGAIGTMTVSWGGMGILWGKPVATVYIRQSRYTKEFIDAQDLFTVSLFDGHREALSLLGTKSGRDGDKIAEAGFHPIMLGGAPTFEESKAVLVCRKWYQSDITLESMPEAVTQSMYQDGDFHTMYIGEIVGYYEK